MEQPAVVFEDWERVLRDTVPADLRAGYREAVVKYRYWLRERGKSATAESFVPYAPTLGEYVTAEDAATRYTNLAEFARRYGHYMISTGPYFLSGVFPVEGQAVLSHNPNHPDLASRFAGFAAPASPVVEIDGPARVTIGDEAAFDVFVDVFDGVSAIAQAR